MCVHKRIHKIGRAMLMVTAGLMAAGLIAAGAHAQTYTISQNAKSVGTANLSIRQAGGGPGGTEVTSGSKIAMSGLNFSFSATQALDAGYRLRNVQLSGLVNGTAATVNVAAQGQGLQVKINANGQVTQTPLASHPLAVFWPDFDPAALQIALDLGAANNNRDLWAVVPKQTGSIVPLRIATKANEQGTLSGKLLVVHHLTISLQGAATTSIEVFTGESNELLQAEWTDEGFSMVRQGFRLRPPARPENPPPAQPPAQSPNQDQAQPQQPPQN